jgi:type I restriction enzyme S subunit
MNERNGDWPFGWVRTTLDEIGTLYCGQSPPSITVNGDGKGTVYVTGPEQWDGARVLTDKWTTDPRRIVPDGCIFVTVKGAGVGTIFPGIACAIGRDIYAYCPSASVSSAFIQHALHATIDEVKRQAQGDIPGLSKNHLLKHEIGFPPLAEQRRIAAKIVALQERSLRAREALAEVGPLLEQFRQSALAAAFRGDLTANWRAAHPNVEPASELLNRIRSERRRLWEQSELAKYEAKDQKPPKNWQDKYEELELVDDTDLPKLPEGWIWSTLGAISVIQGGVTLGQKKRAGVRYISVPYLRVANVQRGYLDLSEVKTIEVTLDRLEQLRLQDGDLLFNEGGDRDKLGRGWIWKAEIEDCIHQNHVFRARLLSNELLPDLISHYANEFGREFFFRRASQTVNLASINKTQLSRLPVPITIYSR